MQKQPTKLLFIVLPHWDMPKLTAKIQPSLKQYCSHIDIVKSREQYYALPDKYQYEIIACWGLPGLCKELIEDQMKNRKNFKYMHSLSVGVDEVCSIKDFRDSDIPLTNARGAFADILAEYVLLGMLYHGKYVEEFQDQKARALWKVRPVDSLATKTLAVVGYGNIGSVCAGAAKRAFGMRVIGVNKFPEMVSAEEKKNCDELVGLDKYEWAVSEADYILGALPRMTSTDNFFNWNNCFSKMKDTGVFMNIGRGTTVDEDDLAKALNTGRIKGAVLDVFKVEPLAKENKLWYAKNLFITPHCADQDADWLYRSMEIFEKNLKNYMTGQPLINIQDKEFAY